MFLLTKVGLPLPWLVYGVYRGITASVSTDGCVRYLYAKNGRFSSAIPDGSDPESTFAGEKGALLDVGALLKLADMECYLTTVKALTLFFSLLLLLTMIVIFIGVIAIFKWKLTKGLGVVLVVMYFVFLIQDILRDPNISYYTATVVFGWTRF